MRLQKGFSHIGAHQTAAEWSQSNRFRLLANSEHHQQANGEKNSALFLPQPNAIQALVPNSSQKNPPPWLLPLIILVIDIAVIAVLGALGMLAKLPPWAQFYYGAATFGVPLFIYWFLKRRQERGE